jgi:hypothetical protein
MALSWNEVKERAFKFSKEWADTYNEEADAKPFLEAFFTVFGISRKKVGTFEHRVKKLNEHDGYIDLFWKGMLLVEMKSKGKDLDKAYTQAREYMQTLPQHELPKCVLICDFETFRLYDLEEHELHQFKLKDLRTHAKLFGFMMGRPQKVYKAEDPVNIDAAELMGHLHDELKDVGYTGHHLELYLVRLLFCLFAEDTSIFEPDAFKDYILQKTKDDGSDIGIHIAQLFQVLNTPYEQRMSTMDEDLAAFPYVNGKLFEENLPFASWNSKMRKSLLAACELNWGKISPAIFGSMFQSVMDEKARRNLGAHYTSEKNILKLIKPLFLDELWNEFKSAKKTKPKLEAFHKKIANLRFIDPACGCGNFLVISYRELRLLEIEVIKELLYTYQGYRKDEAADARIKANLLIRCSINNFFGIEYEEFPAQIAQVAMWLVDHQMNMLVTDTFGQYVSMLPLQRSATIINDNALRVNWHTFDLEGDDIKTIYAKNVEIIQIIDEQDGGKPRPYGITNETITTVNEPVERYRLEIRSRNLTIKKPRNTRGEDATPYNYILGNPPFIGKSLMNKAQKADVAKIFKGFKGAGVLDYVTCWYIKAAQYLNRFSTETFPIKCAFVSTNSISQGEQVGILWNEMFNKYHIKIHFAHKTFKWSNEARGNAGVHVVIIGFSNFDTENKTIYEYDEIKGEPHLLLAKNINPYLVEAKDLNIVSRTVPICKVEEMNTGSTPVDDGNFLFTPLQKEAFLLKEPGAAPYFKKIIGSQEFINNEERWCLWLRDAAPNDLRSLPLVMERISNVMAFRLKSVKEATREKSKIASRFAEIRQPKSDYLVIPSVSSERRIYIPIGFIDKDTIVSNLCTYLPNASFYSFGILSSIMHLVWVKYTCGRLESRYRYSTKIVYNNYPWPLNPTDKQMQAIEAAAQKVLDARTEYSNSSLADLYDPLTMPSTLVKAHNDLDKAVDLAYRPQPFTTEAKRMEFLFELYEQYTKDLFTKEKVKTTRKKQTV